MAEFKRCTACMASWADRESFLLNKDELSRCPEACECAYVREVLQVVRKRLERTAGEG